MKVVIPVSAEKLGGPFVEVEEGFEVKAERDGAVLVEFLEVPAEVEWMEAFELMYGRRQKDGSVKVIRSATDEERKRFRVPVWVQDEEVPVCCGKAMHFVGQLDDDALCAERPKGAKMWWHDAASFYVFTCDQCLGVKAVGQQY